MKFHEVDSKKITQDESRHIAKPKSKCHYGLATKHEKEKETVTATTQKVE